ncbi:MAG: fibronectin type III domain-containing protein [Actinomycetota bacterium]|nr:fibronectin type III domain-containing protein [Actinomycetota bacterium]
MGRGLVYEGLERVSRSHFCRGNFQLQGVTVMGRPVCTHGPDPAPEGVDVTEDRQPPGHFDGPLGGQDGAGGDDGAGTDEAGLDEAGFDAADEAAEAAAARAEAAVARAQARLAEVEARLAGEDVAPADLGGSANDVAAASLVPGSGLAAATQVPCVGNGSDGFRVQLIYARASDRPDGYASWLPSLQQYAAQMDDVFNASAAETGGARHIRFMHDASCVPSIHNVVLTPFGDDSFNSTYRELRSKGYSRTDRKYLVWIDANVYCGIAEVYYDDSPGIGNASNGSTSVPGEVGLVGKACWGQPNSVEAHELVHVLGGVQTSAPNATFGNHCTDNYDRLCYSDGTGFARVVCSDPGHENRLDCNHDDYYSTSPAPFSYLATHWNTANSRFLTGSGSGSPPPPPPPSPTTTTTAPPPTATTAPPTTAPPTTAPPPTTTTTVPPPPPPPTASLPSNPQSLYATQPTAGRGVLLFWSPPASPGNPPFTTYRIYRGAGPTNLTHLTDVGTSVSTYTDTATTIGALYWYQVSAVGSAGEGPRSNLARMVAR